MTQTLHLASLTHPGEPLCGRVLSRNATLTQRDHATMITSQTGGTAAGFHPDSAKPTRWCKHCRRKAGLLPPLTRSRGRDAEGEQEDSMSEDELLAGLLDQDDTEELLDMVEGRQ